MELRSRYNRLVKGDVCHLERHYQIVRETPKAYATKVVLETINWLRRKIGGMVKTHGMRQWAIRSQAPKAVVQCTRDIVLG